MSTEQSLTNRVKTSRLARGWSQDDLAARAGIFRAGVSAIETERLVPSTAAALALAAAPGVRRRRPLPTRPYAEPPARSGHGSPSGSHADMAVRTWRGRSYSIRPRRPTWASSGTTAFATREVIEKDPRPHRFLNTGRRVVRSGNRAAGESFQPPQRFSHDRLPLRQAARPSPCWPRASFMPRESILPRPVNRTARRPSREHWRAVSNCLRVARWQEVLPWPRDATYERQLLLGREAAGSAPRGRIGRTGTSGRSRLQTAAAGRDM